MDRKLIPALIFAVLLLAIASPFLFEQKEAQALAQPVSIAHASDTGLFSSNPTMLTNGPKIYAVWESTDFDHGSDIFLAVSENGGKKFGNPVNISDGGSSSASTPKLAIIGNNIYVVWQSSNPDTSGTDIVLVKIIDDNGDLSVGSQFTISDSSQAAYRANQQVVASDPDIIVAWDETDPDTSVTDILLVKITDENHLTIGDPVNLSNSVLTGISTSSVPQISMGEGPNATNNIYVAWQSIDPNAFTTDIILEKLTVGPDNGDLSIGDPVNLTIGNDLDSVNPQIAVAASPNATSTSIYVAWQSINDPNTTAGNLVLARISDDGDLSIGETVDLDAGGQRVVLNQRIALSDSDDGSILYVIWQANEITDDPNQFLSDILLTTITDDGDISVGDTVNLSSNYGASQTPTIALSKIDGAAYVAWIDNYLAPGSNEVFSIRIPADDGTGCRLNVSNDAGFSSSPTAVISSSQDPASEKIHIIWQDLLADQSDILFEKNIDYGQPLITVDFLDNPTPLWGSESVALNGTAPNALPDDTITVEWGDGASTTDVPVSKCNWGPIYHNYSSSSVGFNNIQATLFEDNGNEKATLDGPIQVQVQKHQTVLTLDSIPSVEKGKNVTVTGSLIDPATGGGIANATISLDGSGILEPDTLTDSGIDGSFSWTGASVDTVAEGWTAQAHFAGDAAFEASESAQVSYNTVKANLTAFPVSAGLNSKVAINGFDTSITFENVLADGNVFVAKCTAPANTSRFIPLDGTCLEISPGVQTAQGTFAHVEISFAGKELPEGFEASDVDVFQHRTSGEIVDLTESRNEVSKTVTARVLNFDELFAGVALHNENVTAIRQQVFVGADRHISLRDISSQQNQTSAIRLDKSSYQTSDTATITILDPDRNLDVTAVDKLLATVKSATSEPQGISVELTETGLSTNEFVGQFTFSNAASSGTVLQAESGDALSINYTQFFGARFEAILQDVQEAGVAQMTDFQVEPFPCFKPIGAAVKMELLDVGLSPNTNITVTLSYANALLLGDRPEFLRLFHKDPELDKWVDITLRGPDEAVIGVNNIAKTVTGRTNSAGAFSIGSDTGCPGGAGGGLARPGTGIVLDFVASVVTQANRANNAGTGQGGQGATSTTSIPQGSEVESKLTIGTDKVEVNFEEVLASGSIAGSPLKPSELPADAFASVEGDQRTMNVDGTEAELVGKIYDITTSNSFKFNGDAEITIPYDLSASDESYVRILLYDDKKWEDVTVDIDTETNTVKGRLNSFSPVTAAILQDGTFSPMYYEVHPQSEVALSNMTVIDAAWNEVTKNPDSERRSISETDVTVRNTQRIQQEYVALVQITNQEGVAVSISSASGILQAGDLVTVAIGPTDVNLLQYPGTYTLKMFLIDNLGHAPTILSSTIKMEL